MGSWGDSSGQHMKKGWKWSSTGGWQLEVLNLHRYGLDAVREVSSLQTRVGPPRSFREQYTPSLAQLFATQRAPLSANPSLRRCAGGLKA